MTWATGEQASDTCVGARLNRFDVLIVGGGHGGAQAAISLRQNGFLGSIAIVTDEPDLPYERPPLSKSFLSGQRSFEEILIRPAGFWAEREIRFLLNTRIAGVDPDAHAVTSSSGQRFAYRALIWAAGSTPRQLTCPGAELRGVFTIRKRADVEMLKAALPSVRHAVIVGGGFIGLEAAAVLAELGRNVVLLEAQNQVLARVAGMPVARFYEAEHRARGVDVRLNTTVTGIDAGEDRVASVRLADGTALPADVVIVGIGAIAEAAPLIAAGANGGGNGVLVDAQCRTSLPDVYAIGDCALHANRFGGGGPIRLESVQNATGMATVAAKTIIGLDTGYGEIPWFWSHQYDLKLQTLGLSSGSDELIVRGDPATRSFSAIYLRDSRVVAIDCVNRARDFAQGRKLIGRHAPADASQLADIDVALSDLAPEPRIS